MSYDKTINQIAIVGTGTIGASWTAHYLARGFDVVATDPGPDAEAKLRKYVDDAWGLLEKNGLAAGASRDRLSFTTNQSDALAKADFVQESAPEREDFTDPPDLLSGAEGTYETQPRSSVILVERNITPRKNGA